MKIKVNGQDIKISKAVLFSHSEGIVEAEFEFDDTWEGWDKVAVFQLASNRPVAVELENDSCTVPAEALKTSGKLKIGIYGQKDGMVMPTKWLESIRVLAGVPIVPVAEET